LPPSCLMKLEMMNNICLMYSRFFALNRVTVFVNTTFYGLRHRFPLY
jgi:hypothetical protein